jgi:single-strand DNA-binding protein
MATGYNHIVLHGNLVRAPEQRDVGAHRVCKITLAVNEYVGKDKPEIVTFVDGEMWDARGDIAMRFLAKGDPCTIAGKLRVDEWEKDGVKRSRPKVRVDELILCGGGRRDGGGRSDPDIIRTEPDNDGFPF